MSRIRSLSPPREVKPIILGIFGSHGKIKEKELIDYVLTPILKECGRLPDKVLVPSDGNSSMFIQCWAERLRIPFQVILADWKRSGKAGGIMRDSRIQSECTYALVFLSPRSTRYEKYAEKMALSKRDPKKVFTVTYHDVELALLEPSEE
jgi:hypothetical protein